jgi:hypothetical protein
MSAFKTFLIGLLCLSFMGGVRSEERNSVILPIFGYSDATGAQYGLMNYNYGIKEGPTIQAIYLQAEKGGNLLAFSLERGFLSPSLSVELGISSNSFYESFFGFGNNTARTNLKEIEGTFFNANAALRFYWNPQNSLALGFIKKSREENFQKNSVTYFPNEILEGYQLSYLADSRDMIPNAHAGYYFEGTYIYYPYQGGVSKVTLDGRWYWPVGFNTLAMRAVAGQLEGNASFMNLFRLGSSTLLRGAGNNRYADRAFTAFQWEYRAKLWERLAGVLTLEWGRVGDRVSLSDTFHFSKGLGLRIAVDETEKAQIRFDWSSGEDLGQFFVGFNQAF